MALRDPALTRLLTDALILPEEPVKVTLVTAGDWAWVLPDEDEGFEEGCPDCGCDTVVEEAQWPLDPLVYCSNCGWRE